MELRLVKDADVAGKTVLVRVDFNVPLQDGKVADDTRILAALPTIILLIERGAKVILCSHLGRPKGQVVQELRLDPIVDVLRDRLNLALTQKSISPMHVAKLDDCVGEEVELNCKNIAPDHIGLLENLRFHKGETSNDPAFATKLAALADVFVNDAFGTVHRAHASTEGIARLLPSYAGLLVEREVMELSKVTNDPKRPLTVILGGAKISGKIEVLESMIPIADHVLIGGAMANTFFKAQGLEVGGSLVEDS
ncbi:MAG: phosphoglycerate kinase, partial [Boseongicola sp.]